MANKMTQRDYFKEIIALAEENGREDIVTFAQGRIEMLDKKAGSKKPTKTQAENVAIKDEILSVLTTVGATVTDIQAKSEMLGALSNQKVSALLRQMVEDGTVVKSTEKKKSYFALAE
jgi:hypothetical protein